MLKRAKTALTIDKRLNPPPTVPADEYLEGLEAKRARKARGWKPPETPLAETPPSKDDAAK